MQRFARIDGGTVVEIVSLPDGVAPSAAFHASIADALKPAPAEVQQGWSWTGSAFAAPAAAPPPSADALAAYAADKRWRVASGGLVVSLPGGGTLAVPSDDTAYGRLKGAAQDLADGIITAPITIVLGLVVVTADRAMAEVLYGAISQHWQASYATQGAVVDGILAGTITTFAQIDSAGWPPNA